MHTTIDSAWKWTLGNLVSVPGRELSSVIITVQATGGRLVDDPKVRNHLDAFLRQAGKRSVLKTAEPVFPKNLWHPGEHACDFYARQQERDERYTNVYGKVLKKDYFARMSGLRGNGGLQIQHVIEAINRKCLRRSGLVINVFDPKVDSSFQPIQGFPCLHEVHFNVRRKVLHLNAVYPLQHCVTKQYGNLLGLGWLGEFVAEQTGAVLGSVTCYASTETVGDGITKAKAKILYDLVR